MSVVSESDSSSGSSWPSGSTHSPTQLRAEAATLKARLQFLELEAAHRIKQEQLKHEAEELMLRKELCIAEARLTALLSPPTDVLGNPNPAIELPAQHAITPNVLHATTPDAGYGTTSYAWHTSTPDVHHVTSPDVQHVTTSGDQDVPLYERPHVAEPDMQYVTVRDTLRAPKPRTYDVMSPDTLHATMAGTEHATLPNVQHTTASNVQLETTPDVQRASLPVGHPNLPSVSASVVRDCGTELDEVPTNAPRLTLHTSDEPHQSTPQDGRDTPQPTPYTPRYADSELSFSDTKDTGQMERLVQLIGLSRLPAPEPKKFSGDPLQFPEWRSAFETLITQRGVPVLERFYYLRQYITGEAKQAIDGFLFLSDSEEAYTQAMRLLIKRFGDPFVIANAFRDKLEAWPKINTHDGKGMRKFADFLGQCEAAMDCVGSLRVLHDERENRKIVSKLPDWLVMRWTRKVVEWKQAHKIFPPFGAFVRFMQNEADVCCEPVVSVQSLKGSSNSNVTKKVKTHQANSEVNTPSTSNPSCPLCKGMHDLENCSKYMTKTLDQRKSFIIENKLCFACLKAGHQSRTCKQRRVCKTCQKRHPTSLHGDVRPTTTSPSAVPSSTIVPQMPSVHTGASTVNGSKLSRATMIVPVWLSHKGNPERERLVYAMLDTQSDTTFVLNDTARALDVTGPDVNLLLSTMLAADQRVRSTKITGLEVRGYNCAQRISLPVCYSRNIMPVSRDTIPTPEMASVWPHLKPISSEIMPLGSFEVGLLIGYNCPAALVPREVIASTGDEPYGQRTDLGWSIIGLVGDTSTEQDDIGTSHRIMTCEVPLELSDSSSNQYGSEKVILSFPNRVKEVFAPVDVVRMMELDFSEQGLDSLAPSREDQMFLSKLKDGIHVREDGHFEMPLPFRCTDPVLPNNRTMVVKRLLSLKRRLNQDLHFRRDYITFMTTLIEDGHAELVPSGEVRDGSVWYIPHHGVYHPKKPDKIRVVFDCSAQFDGTSLNAHLLKGPDLTSSLIGVLLRFRMEQIAFTCDIEKMFYQFGVNAEHRDYPRFVWFKDNDLNAEIVDYRMCVHLFGASSSPNCATFGLQETARVHGSKYGSDVQDFIHRHFYVDDGLKSTSTTSEAIHLVTSSRKLCAEAGIRLHKFTSNSRNVLSAVPVEDRASGIKNIDLSCDTLPVERTLGVQWCVETDNFQFRITLKDQPCTRRGILSTISSVYDPLGFVAPVIMVGKRILQELCSSGLDWDEPVPDDLKAKWEKWRSSLPSLKSVDIPRCYKPPGFGKVCVSELHHFSDASTEGYGVCSYLRCVNTDGDICCSLVMGKSRVAPLKAVTIPRLELTAATVAIKVSTLLHTEIDIANTTDFYWTDSSVVLGYINNDVKRFHVYVANRVQHIRDNSDPSQWRHVSSADNPADDASRGLDAENLKTNSRWLCGPDFLWQSEIPLSMDGADVELKVDDPEVKRSVSHVVAGMTHPFASILERLERFSDWTRARRAVALCIRYMMILRNRTKKNKEPIEDYGVRPSVSEIENAGIIIVKLVQNTCFPEVDSLEVHENEEQGDRRKTVKRGSRLYKLDPFVDSKHVMRVGGRLGRSTVLSEGLRHPIILPKSHHITDLIIRHAHLHTYHQGRGITINMIRSCGFWIIGCSGAVSKYIFKCVTCRKLRASVAEQRMANLPPDRMDCSTPFTYVGIDCFGPFLIKEGRRELKRYGTLFTCLATRAIHIEVATSLSTDSFLNALRRVISIRGPIRLLRCDQGTNFVGANHELQAALKEMDHDHVSSYLIDKGCDFVPFKFNPPSASHAGGVWERQIRTVRNVLSGILQQSQSQLDDDGLRTLFYEVTAIVNGRPLTVDNLHDTSLEPLTPNHILTMKSHIILPPPGQFQKEDLYLRKMWRRVQYLTNQFWYRWKREYLQNLQTRQRWNIKQRNFCIGDIVMIKDENIPRNQWRLGKIMDVNIGTDSCIRSVGLLVMGKRIERPIQKLVVLIPVEDC